jgi:2-dehydropantoate 2-reductase
MAWALRLPNSVVSWAADASGISGNSFAGTLQDLHRGRHTEVHELNGEIVALAQRYGHEAPANRIVLNVVRRHESNVIARRKPQFLSPRQLRGLIERAQLNTERPRASSYQATVELGV